MLDPNPQRLKHSIVTPNEMPSYMHIKRKNTDAEVDVQFCGEEVGAPTRTRNVSHNRHHLGSCKE